MQKSTVSWPHVIAGLAMVASLGAAYAMTPKHYAVQEGSVDLEKMIPREFAGWREVGGSAAQIDLTPRDGGETTIDQPYDQTLMRTYVRSDGAAVMLALAYGRTQRQEVKIHRPELCYVAQGYAVSSRTLTALDLGQGREIPAYRLVTQGQQRVEPVTYWVRIGDAIPLGGFQTRLQILKEGLHGTIPDGILVRVSQAVPPGQDVAASYKVQDAFLSDLVRTVDDATRLLLRGAN